MARQNRLRGLVEEYKACCHSVLHGRLCTTIAVPLWYIFVDLIGRGYSYPLNASCAAIGLHPPKACVDAQTTVLRSSSSWSLIRNGRLMAKLSQILGMYLSSASFQAHFAYIIKNDLHQLLFEGSEKVGEVQRSLFRLFERCLPCSSAVLWEIASSCLNASIANGRCVVNAMLLQYLSPDAYRLLVRSPQYGAGALYMAKWERPSFDQSRGRFTSL